MVSHPDREVPQVAIGRRGEAAQAATRRDPVPQRPGTRPCMTWSQHGPASAGPRAGALETSAKPSTANVELEARRQRIWEGQQHAVSLVRTRGPINRHECRPHKRRTRPGHCGSGDSWLTKPTRLSSLSRMNPATPPFLRARASRRHG